MEWTIAHSPPPPGCAIAGRADGVRVRGFRTI